MKLWQLIGDSLWFDGESPFLESNFQVVMADSDDLQLMVIHYGNLLMIGDSKKLVMMIRYGSW